MRLCSMWTFLLLHRCPPVLPVLRPRRQRDLQGWIVYFVENTQKFVVTSHCKICSKVNVVWLDGKHVCMYVRTEEVTRSGPHALLPALSCLPACLRRRCWPAVLGKPDRRTRSRAVRLGKRQACELDTKGSNQPIIRRAMH